MAAAAAVIDFDNGTATMSVTVVATIGILRGVFRGDQREASAGSADTPVVLQLNLLAGDGPLPDGPPDCTDGLFVKGVLTAVEP
jgi:hypothetical protein